MIYLYLLLTLIGISVITYGICIYYEISFLVLTGSSKCNVLSIEIKPTLQNILKITIFSIEKKLKPIDHMVEGNLYYRANDRLLLALEGVNSHYYSLQINKREFYSKVFECSNTNQSFTTYFISAAKKISKEDYQELIYNYTEKVKNYTLIN